jgi:hypothetical protein
MNRCRRFARWRQLPFGNSDALGENLSFTPWHALPEHRPLGGINRARKVIYDLISTFRHRENDQPRREPLGFDD